MIELMKRKVRKFYFQNKNLH